MKEEGNAQFSFTEFGQKWKELKEFWEKLKNIWSLICNVFVSAQIVCFVIALFIMKIRHDQWLWQLAKIRQNQPQLGAAASEESIVPRIRKRRIRAARRECREMPDSDAIAEE